MKKLILVCLVFLMGALWGLSWSHAAWWMPIDLQDLQNEFKENLPSESDFVQPEEQPAEPAQLNLDAVEIQQDSLNVQGITNINIPAWQEAQPMPLAPSSLLAPGMDMDVSNVQVLSGGPSRGLVVFEYMGDVWISHYHNWEGGSHSGWSLAYNISREEGGYNAVAAGDGDNNYVIAFIRDDEAAGESRAHVVTYRNGQWSMPEPVPGTSRDHSSLGIGLDRQGRWYLVATDDRICGLAAYNNFSGNVAVYTLTSASRDVRIAEDSCPHHPKVNMNKYNGDAMAFWHADYAEGTLNQRVYLADRVWASKLTPQAAQGIATYPIPLAPGYQPCPSLSGCPKAKGLKVGNNGQGNFYAAWLGPDNIRRYAIEFYSINVNQGASGNVAHRLYADFTAADRDEFDGLSMGVDEATRRASLAFSFQGNVYTTTAINPTAFSASFSQPQRLDETGDAVKPVMGVAPTGQILVAWIHQANDSNWNVAVRRLNAATQPDKPVENIENLPGKALQLSVAVNGPREALVGWVYQEDPTADHVLMLNRFAAPAKQ